MSGMKLFYVAPRIAMVFDCEYPVLAETDAQAADLWIEGILNENLSCDLGEVCDPDTLERGLAVRCAHDFEVSGPARVLEWDEVRSKETVVSIVDSNAWKAALAKGFDPETCEWAAPEDAPSMP